MDGHWRWQNPLCYLSGMPFINNPALHFMTAFYLEPNCIFLTCGASAQTLKQEEMYIRCYRKKGSGTISGNSEYNNVLSDTIPWMATQKKKIIFYMNDLKDDLDIWMLGLDFHQWPSTFPATFPDVSVQHSVSWLLLLFPLCNPTHSLCTCWLIGIPWLTPSIYIKQFSWYSHLSGKKE